MVVVHVGTLAGEEALVFHPSHPRSYQLWSDLFHRRAQLQDYLPKNTGVGFSMEARSGRALPGTREPNVEGPEDDGSELAGAEHEPGFGIECADQNSSAREDE